MQKPKLLLLDANVVIEAHRLGAWTEICDQYEIGLPSIIVSEARYFESEEGGGSIHLQDEIKAGTIAVFEGTVAEISAAFSNISDAFLAGIDAGEAEAIALLFGDCSDHRFCTGDVNAIQLMGMLSLEANAISFERLAHGLKSKGKLKVQAHFTEKTFKHHLGVGKGRRISGEYFRKALF